MYILYIDLYVYMYIYTCMYTYMYIYIHTHVCRCIYIYSYTHINIYLYTHMYVYVNIYLYPYIYMPRWMMLHLTMAGEQGVRQVHSANGLLRQWQFGWRQEGAGLQVWAMLVFLGFSRHEWRSGRCVPALRTCCQRQGRSTGHPTIMSLKICLSLSF